MLRKDPSRAWRWLLDGNAQYVSASMERCERQSKRTSLEWRANLLKGQHPLAAVLGCADSRVSPVMMFGCGQGDLFVVRNAGNVADDAAIASIEYAVLHLGVPLIIVLGHESCGAVTAAFSSVCRGAEPADGSKLDGLLRRIQPAVRGACEHSGPTEGLDCAVRSNVRQSVRDLLAESVAIRSAVADGRVRIVACTVSLATGRVDELDPVS